MENTFFLYLPVTSGIALPALLKPEEDCQLPPGILKGPLQATDRVWGLMSPLQGWFVTRCPCSLPGSMVGSLNVSALASYQHRAEPASSLVRGLSLIQNSS